MSDYIFNHDGFGVLAELADTEKNADGVNDFNSIASLGTANCSTTKKI